MACVAAPAGAVDAGAAPSGAQDAGCNAATHAPSLRVRLLSYFRDTAEGEPGGAEADPLQAMWLEGDSLAPFVVTPLANVLRALDLAAVGPDDVLLDVGCGDGRVVVAAAALCGASARGVELEAPVAALAQRAVCDWAAETQNRAEVRCGDATAAGALYGATVVFAALLPDGVALLAPALHAARCAGARLVTLHFPLPPAAGLPAAVDAQHRLFFYTPLSPEDALDATP